MVHRSFSSLQAMLKGTNFFKLRGIKNVKCYSNAAAGHLPLTTLTDDEIEIKSSVLKFAKEVIKPQVMKMDESSKMDPAIISQCFENGTSDY